MNTFSISKSFTAVVVLLVALNGWAAADSKAASTSADTYEECTDKAVYKCVQECKNDPNAKPTCQSDCQYLGQYTECNKIKRAEKDKKEKDQEKKDADAKCTTLISDYKKINEKTKSQCARAKQGNTENCKKLANSCGNSLDVGGLEDNGEETPEESEKY